MRALDRSTDPFPDRLSDRAGPRRSLSLLASVLTHAALLVGMGFMMHPSPPAQRVMELALVQRGRPDLEGGATPSADAADTPPARPTPSTVAPAPPPAPHGMTAMHDTAPPSVPSPAAPTAPLSFRDWQRATASPYLPSRAIEPGGGGTPDGRDLVTQHGRDRCDPPAGRPADVVYLLFDSSGSMSSVARAQALGCANQYARSVLDHGAIIVVGNFARGVTFSLPTRSLLDVEIALRSASDARATNLPARQLQPFLAEQSGAASDLVIISDGWFETPREVLVWYRYFLESGAENRGIMYTVGTPGHRDAVGQLRGLGFDVYEYLPLRRSHR